MIKKSSHALEDTVAVREQVEIEVFGYTKMVSLKYEADRYDLADSPSSVASMAPDGIVISAIAKIRA